MKDKERHGSEQPFHGRRTELGVIENDKDLPNDEKEIIPEKIRVAKETILTSLNMDQETDLDNFDEKLKEATKSLSRYKEIEKELSGIEGSEIIYKLFKLLKKSADKKNVDENSPRDGVLISSMQDGQLECAGRTLIASTFLQESGIDHVVVSAPGHSFMVIEQSPETLIYFDANNDLFFTFPKSALAGYQNTQTTAECRLREYTPREDDLVDGVNTAFSHFISMPAREAIGRQYLGNIAAALHGNAEFSTSNIEKDMEASEAVRQLEFRMYGENEVLDGFYQKVETLIELEDAKTEDDRMIVSEILQRYPDRSNFINAIIGVIGGNLGDRIPYIKNAPDEKKRDYAEKLWVLMQEKQTESVITGR